MRRNAAMARSARNSWAKPIMALRRTIARMTMLSTASPRAPAIAAEGIRLMRIGLAPRLRELVGGDITRITPREMAQAAAEGDDDVREAILRAADYLGLAVANTITVLHPELVVLGGGVAKIGDLLFDRVREVVRQDVRMFPADGVRIEPSLLAERAGVMGALALASRGIDSANP